MKIIDCIQGKPEWHQARCGRITASDITCVLAGKTTAKRKDYLYSKVAEIISGVPYEGGYQSQEMRRGTEQEPFARTAYECATNQLITQVGFVVSDINDRFGCSPDGFTEDGKGLIEVKNPKSSTQFEYIDGNVVPPDYIPQCLWQMFVCEKEYVDFVSYDDRLPDHLRLFIKRLERDDKAIQNLIDHANVFLYEINELVRKYRRIE